MSACRVLFVDDEPRVLDGIQRLLRSRKKGWEVATAAGPQVALSMMRERPFDVVVSDMRMPVMDGVALLSMVREEMPSTVRIVLSGQADVESVVRAAPVAHQLLAKPCDATLLTSAIESGYRAQTLQQSLALRDAVGGVRALPSLPEVCRRLAELVSEEDVDFARVARAIEQDVGVAAKVLQLVNSPFFGARRRLHTLRDGVAFLGVTLTRNFVLAMGALSAFGPALERAKLDLARFQQHATRVAMLARRIAPPALADEAFTAGLLSDVGQLVLAVHCPDAYRASREKATSRDEVLASERALCGFTHAEAGGMLVGLWGFGWPTIEAVTYHAAPSALREVSGAEGGGLVDAVHAAHVLLDEAGAACASPCARGAELAVDPAQRAEWLSVACALVSDDAAS
jgi:HD-like signal output (HDOD) protein